MKERGKLFLVLVLAFLFTLFLFLNLSFSFVSAGTLKVTEEHPFLVNGEWISASQLKVGDVLQTVDGKNVTIKKITPHEISEPFSVYNLEAGIYHDFVVADSSEPAGEEVGGLERIIVHNSNRLDPLDPCVSSGTSPPICKNLVKIDSPPLGYKALKPTTRVNFASDSELERRILEATSASRITSQEADILRKALPVIKSQKISFEDFVKTLRTHTANAFNKLDSKPYVIISGYRTGKSPNWVYELTKPYLKNNPLDEIYLSGMDSDLSKSPLVQLIKDNKVQRVVTFDDISYSGLEINDNFLSRFNMFYKGAGLNEPVEFVIATPYISTEALDTFSRTIRSSSFSRNIKVRILDWRPIRTTEEALSQINPMTGTPYLTPSEIAIFESKFGSGSTLVSADHKIADGVSFPGTLSGSNPSIFGDNGLFEIGYYQYKSQHTIYKLEGTLYNSRETERWNRYTQRFN
jgi:hypothetical protein